MQSDVSLARKVVLAGLGAAFIASAIVVAPEVKADHEKNIRVYGAWTAAIAPEVSGKVKMTVECPVGTEFFGAFDEVRVLTKSGKWVNRDPGRVYTLRNTSKGRVGIIVMTVDPGSKTFRARAAADCQSK